MGEPTQTVTVKPTFTPTLSQKLNPIWWLQNSGPNGTDGGTSGFDAPAENNGAPYLPEVTSPFLRAFYWWWRNPAANFVEYILGVADKERTITGSEPVMSATRWDDWGLKTSDGYTQTGFGWKFAKTETAPSLSWAVGTFAAMIVFFILCALSPMWLLGYPVIALCALRAIGWLPFVSYSGMYVLWYAGWRYGGGFGVKINGGH